jgi:hypothetical protein
MAVKNMRCKKLGRRQHSHTDTHMRTPVGGRKGKFVYKKLLTAKPSPDGLPEHVCVLLQLKCLVQTDKWGKIISTGRHASKKYYYI